MLLVRPLRHFTTGCPASHSSHAGWCPAETTNHPAWTGGDASFRFPHRTSLRCQRVARERMVDGEPFRSPAPKGAVALRLANPEHHGRSETLRIRTVPGGDSGGHPACDVVAPCASHPRQHPKMEGTRKAQRACFEPPCKSSALSSCCLRSCASLKG